MHVCLANAYKKASSQASLILLLSQPLCTIVHAHYGRSRLFPREKFINIVEFQAINSPLSWTPQNPCTEHPFVIVLEIVHSATIQKS